MKRSFLLYLIIPIINCSCPDGLEPVAAGECRQLEPIYMKLPDNQATDTAISQCNALQAHPVIIHNDEQQSYWAGKQKERGNRLLLGLVCNTSTLKWQWSDGSPVDHKPPSSLYNPALTSNCSNGCVWFISKTSEGFWDALSSSAPNHFDFFCTVQLPHQSPSGDGCESFADDSDDGVCYQVSNVAQNWKDAQTICRTFGANAASVHNAQENSFLRRLAVSKGAVNGMYLGASTSGKGNQLGWVDGSEWDYDQFYPGFPVNGLGDCVIMDTGDTSGDWANVDCSAQLAVACMRKQNAVSLDCSSEFWTTEGQILYSPGYPFDATIPCDFILSVDSGKKVELEILILESNTCCDHLIIHENYFGSNIIANLTGELSNTFFTTTSSNFMKVSWQPTDGTNVRGVMMTFRGV